MQRKTASFTHFGGDLYGYIHCICESLYYVKSESMPLIVLFVAAFKNLTNTFYAHSRVLYTQSILFFVYLYIAIFFYCTYKH